MVKGLGGGTAVPAGRMKNRRRSVMQVSLVIMAAGLGSRYGGSKQVDGIGPSGEILME